MFSSYENEKKSYFKNCLSAYIFFLLFLHICQEDIVKLQILNLAVKLCITNSKQTKLLCQYVMNLAKYDQNYDIRDRSRFLRQFVLTSDKPCALSKYAKKIFLATKPAPVLASKFNGEFIDLISFLIRSSSLHEDIKVD